MWSDGTLQNSSDHLMRVEWWEYTELNRSFDVCGMVGTLQNSSGHLMCVEWWEYTELNRSFDVCGMVGIHRTQQVI